MSLVSGADKTMVDDALRKGWEAMRVLQGGPTINIVRRETEGDNDALVVEGTGFPVSDLSDIPAAVFPAVKKQVKVRGMVRYQESYITWVIYDVECLTSDLIEYNGDTHQVDRVDYNSSNGRCVIKGMRI